MKTLAVLAAVATVSAIASGAQAQASSCGGSVQSGVAGATLGASVAGNGNKTEGAMLGAILGYTANAAACRQGARTWPKVQQYQEPQSQRFVPQGQYQGGYAPVSQQYPQQLYAQPQQQECGQGQITVRNPDGTIQRAVTAMCRINGEWKIVQ